MTSVWLRDVLATVVTLGVALGWLRLIDTSAARGVLDKRLGRKVIHIGTGPLFVVCWLLFSSQPAARFLAALVPALITGQFILVGTGLIADPKAVAAMTRHSDRREILRGPLYYGLVFVACTLIFWRTSPIGILALMLMCGGDGLAEGIGRRFGTTRLPINPNKSWAGSAAMLLGGMAFGLAFTGLFWWAGTYAEPLAIGRLAGSVAAIAVAGTLVEALPLDEVDNLTITGTAVVLGLILL
jgi:phytol kinase